MRFEFLYALQQLREPLDRFAIQESLSGDLTARKRAIDVLRSLAGGAASRLRIRLVQLGRSCEARLGSCLPRPPRPSPR